MALTTKIIYVLTFIAFFFGQLARIDIKGISFPIIDIFILVLALVNIIKQIKDKKLVIHNNFFLFFLIFAWINLPLAFFIHNLASIKSVFYLLRLTSLLSFIIFPPRLDEKTQNFFHLIIFSNIIFGLIQYFFWPNFTFFNSLSWDPHLYRLVSTFFDPTFTALIFLFFIIVVFLNKKFPYRPFLLVISYIALALTYSRATFLAFLLAFTFIAIKKKKISIFIFSLILFSLTLLILPRKEGEGTKLERTSSISAKVENYKQAFNLFKQSSVIGFGYNNLSLIRTDIKDSNSHANSGFDGSLMTILVTTGVIGFILFTAGLIKFFKKSDLKTQTILIALLFHSLFANSLLYPFVFLCLIFI